MFRSNATTNASTITVKFISIMRQLSLAGLTILILLALSVPMLAQDRNREARRIAPDELVPRAPLARDDPRAQLDPQLRNALPMPTAERAELRRPTGDAQQPAMVEFNPATGEEKRSVEQAAALTLRQEIGALQMSGDGGSAAQGNEGEQNLTPRQMNLLSPSINICADDQTARYDSRYFPMSAQVKLYMTFPNGGIYVGSGTMIGSKSVITHQNNLYWPAFGGWATKVEVIPGLDGYYRPFLSAFAVRLRYYAHGSANIGLITLDRPIGSATGWFGYGSFTDSNTQSRTGNMAGYPEGKEYGRLYYGYNWATVRDWDWLTVATFFQPGEMGAGVYLKDSVGERYVHSVAAGQSGCSTAADRITNWIFSQVHQVIASGQ